MTRRVTTAVAAALALTLSSCAATIDLRDEAESTDDTETQTGGGTQTGTGSDLDVEQPLSADASLDELFPILLASWRGLDQRVIDGDAAGSLARLEATWVAAEPLVRADHPGSLFGLEQALDLARSAVERRRPADASKGYRLAIELTDEILTS